MTEHRRTHRSHVSYIDKSREYYAAHGYTKPYSWAANDDAPFTPLPKPLADCRIGVITTSYFLPEAFVYTMPADLPRDPAVAERHQIPQLDARYLSWAKEETHADDPESFLPLGRLDELVAEGRIGSVSERFYCLPTQFSQRTTVERDTPQILEWLGEDEVDVVLLVPF
ncbi:MAG: hypothetical protein ACFCVK_02880 [Acidimicrobiales bacterium]